MPIIKLADEHLKPDIMKQILILFFLNCFGVNTFIFGQTVLPLEDFNEQDMFNNFSGDWNFWNDDDSMDIFNLKSKTDSIHVSEEGGACLQLN